MVAGAMLLMGCEDTTRLYLYKDAATVARADTDYFDCELEAARAVPQDTQIETTPVYITPVRTSCTGFGIRTTCSSTGGDVYGGQTYSYDANEDLRTEYFARCLAKRGYSATELPLCDKGSVAPSVLSKLGGKLRQPASGACYFSVTDRAGNVVYANEVQ